MREYNDQLFDVLAVFTTILQLLTLDMTAKDATNNDLMQELQRQDREYLQTIIEQNNKILEQLAKMAD